jgi:hypothetical protein
MELLLLGPHKVFLHGQMSRGRFALQCCGIFWSGARFSTNFVTPFGKHALAIVGHPSSFHVYRIHYVRLVQSRLASSAQTDEVVNKTLFRFCEKRP